MLKLKKNISGAKRLSTGHRLNLVHFWTYLLVPEAHLPTCVPGDIHTAQEHAFFVSWTSGAAHQLRLYSLMVLLIYDVIHAVSMYQQILL